MTHRLIKCACCDIEVLAKCNKTKFCRTCQDKRNKNRSKLHAIKTQKTTCMGRLFHNTRRKEREPYYQEAEGSGYF
jgi:hypothetical protein